EGLRFPPQSPTTAIGWSGCRWVGRHVDRPVTVPAVPRPRPGRARQPPPALPTGRTVTPPVVPPGGGEPATPPAGTRQPSPTNSWVRACGLRAARDDSRYRGSRYERLDGEVRDRVEGVA